MNVMIGRPNFSASLHQPQRFAIAFRIRHSEIPLHPFFEGLAFLMPDDHDRPVVKAGEASDDGAVIAKGAIAVELEEVPAELADVVEGRGPLGMPGELRSLPGSQSAVQFVFDLGEFRPQLADLVLRGRFPEFGGRELFDLLFDLADRLFKLEIIAHRRP